MFSGYFPYPFEISLLFYGYSDYHSYICPNYKQTQDGEEDKTKDKVYFPKGIGRVLEDKRAIRDCIQKGGDVKQLAKERGIQFATPL